MSSVSSWKAKSSESMLSTLSVPYASVKLVVIYHPPRSKKNRSTPAQFRREFQDFFEHHMVRSHNMIIVRDFNIHVDVGSSNTEAECFLDILSTNSLRQHVSGSTNMEGITLDLVISPDRGDLVADCSVSEYLSDHAAVHCTLHLAKPRPVRQTVRYRKYRCIQRDSFTKDIESTVLTKPHVQMSCWGSTTRHCHTFSTNMPLF